MAFWEIRTLILLNKLCSGVKQNSVDSVFFFDFGQFTVIRALNIYFWGFMAKKQYFQA